MGALSISGDFIKLYICSGVTNGINIFISFPRYTYVFCRWRSRLLAVYMLNYGYTLLVTFGPWNAAIIECRMLSYSKLIPEKYKAMQPYFRIWRRTENWCRISFSQFYYSSFFLYLPVFIFPSGSFQRSGSETARESRTTNFPGYVGKIFTGSVFFGVKSRWNIPLREPLEIGLVNDREFSSSTMNHESCGVRESLSRRMRLLVKSGK